jgi:hypothetical protein
MPNSFMTPSLLRWVTLYLLIGLAVLLLAANLFAGNSAASSPAATPTPSKPPTQKDIAATVTAAVKSSRNVDETSPFKFFITVGSSPSSEQIKDEIQKQAMGQKGHAAFIIAYVGGSDPVNARNIAGKVENALQTLSSNSNDPLFGGVAYQSIVFTGEVTDVKGNPHKPMPTVDFEMYLNKQT